MESGIVARIWTEKFYGFIKPDLGKDVFFHKSQCEADFDRLQVGDRVMFEVEPSAKGPRATGVVLE